MDFEELTDVFAAVLPSMQAWGCSDGQRTYAISLDCRHPQSGYRASWNERGRTIKLPEKFKTLARAKRALKRVRDSQAN